jgi:hypothetical protein
MNPENSGDGCRNMIALVVAPFHDNHLTLR